MKILANAARCRKCGDEIYSAYRHDYKKCKCGAIGVDGGMDYFRSTGNREDFEDMSISVPVEVVEQCKKALEWASANRRNNLGTVCAIFRALRDTGYLKGLNND